MTPPEVILDRFVRTQLCKQPGFSDYVGKLDIERIESPSYRSFLCLFQETMNEALRLEGVNASGGVQHLPFHFDYLEVSSGVTNAHAFEHGDSAFIVFTLPLVESVLALSQRVGSEPRVLTLLGLPPEAESGSLQGLLGQIQLNFLASHEHTHHIHKHWLGSQSAGLAVWTEFLDEKSRGGINSQAQELDADGYASYLMLAHLLRGERRQSALALLSRPNSLSTDGDELLLTSFFLAIMAFFCSHWRRDIDTASVHELTHPPPPVRIEHTIRIVEKWCDESGSVPQSWFSPERLRELFRVVAEVIGGTTRQTWDAQISYLRSAEGVQYHQQLLNRFDAIRTSGRNEAQSASS